MTRDTPTPSVRTGTLIWALLLLVAGLWLVHGLAHDRLPPVVTVTIDWPEPAGGPAPEEAGEDVGSGPAAGP